MVTSFDPSKRICSTFYGFPHDKYPLSKEDLFDKNKLPSRLDHIFVKNMEIESNNATIWVDEEQLDNKELLYSDHFLITTNVKSD